jgi:hypothetical protein
MSTSTTPMFDFAELKGALEERDATGQLALYADEAEVTLVDRINTPGSPRVLRGREEIRGWIEDICERDLTHRVEMQVIGAGGAAFTEACRLAGVLAAGVGVVDELDVGAGLAAGQGHAQRVEHEVGAHMRCGRSIFQGRPRDRGGSEMRGAGRGAARRPPCATA